MKITINGVKMDVDKPVLSYEDVCMLANEPDYATVTFHHSGYGISGLLYKGKHVEVVDGMHFNAIVTGDA